MISFEEMPEDNAELANVACPAAGFELARSAHSRAAGR
jgi:hypothetical protein